MKRHLLRAAGALLAASGLLPSQSAVFTPYGASCDFFGQPAALSGSFDPTTSTMTLKQSWSPTCCNTFLATQFLLLGARPLIPGVRHPLLVPGCVLLVEPAAFLSQPRGNGLWVFRVPRLPVAITVYTQGINDYFTTISFSHDLQSTNGLQIDLS